MMNMEPTKNQEIPKTAEEPKRAIPGMFKKISTGRLEFDRETRFLTPEINGEIRKITIYNSKENLMTTRIDIKTVEGEEIANRYLGNAEIIVLKPKDFSLGARSAFWGEMKGEAVFPSQGIWDYYISVGKLIINIVDGKDKTVIENIVVTYKG
jgi:hypothetical protein